MTASQPAWMTNPHAGPAREICPQCDGSKIIKEYGQQLTCECCEGEGMIWASDFPDCETDSNNWSIDTCECPLCRLERRERA